MPAAGRSAGKLIDCTCYDLYVVSPSGGGYGRLLSRGGDRNLFDVSRDRRKILYSNRIDELHASSARGRFKRLLARSSGGQIRDALWSPDGKWILYESDSAACFGRGTEVRVVDRDGDGDRSIGCAAYLIRWASDSRRILFGQYAETGTSKFRLIVSNRDGSNAHEIASGLVGDPQWSPRGDWIAYVRGDYRAPELRLVRPDGTGDRRLARGSVPTWSPDGRRIAFELRRSLAPRFALAVADVDRSRVRTLDPLAVDGYGQGVGWSPDGRTIVYRRLARPRCNVCRMALFTTPVARPHPRRVLTGDPHEEFGPLYWLPDGKQILYTSYIQQGV